MAELEKKDRVPADREDSLIWVPDPAKPQQLPVALTLYGNLNDARDLKHSGIIQLLDLRRENVWGLLDVVRRTTLPDGKLIVCTQRTNPLTNFSQEHIHIYAPKVIKPKEGEEKTLELTKLMPAFEVFDQNWNRVGYVICRSGTWEPPYEFIETTRVIGSTLNRTQAEPVWEDIDITLYPFEWPEWKAYSLIYRPSGPLGYGYGEGGANTSPYKTDEKPKEVLLKGWNAGEKKYYEIVVQGEECTWFNSGEKYTTTWDSSAWESAIYNIWSLCGPYDEHPESGGSWWLRDYTENKGTNISNPIHIGMTMANIDPLVGRFNTSIIGSGVVHATSFGVYFSLIDGIAQGYCLTEGVWMPALDYMELHSSLSHFLTDRPIYQADVDAVLAAAGTDAYSLTQYSHEFADVQRDNRYLYEYWDEFSNFLTATKGAVLHEFYDDYLKLDRHLGLTMCERLTNIAEETNTRTEYVKCEFAVYIDGAIYPLHTYTIGYDNFPMRSYLPASVRYWDVNGKAYVLGCNLNSEEYATTKTAEYFQLKEGSFSHNVHFDLAYSSTINAYYHEIPDVKAPDNGPLYCTCTYRLVKEDEPITIKKEI